MRKLELSIDDLRVESFETSAERGWPGTVFGQQDVLGPGFAEPGAASGQQTCKAWHTCHGAQTCHIDEGCYTYDAGPTCVAPCVVSKVTVCTCLAEGEI